MKRLRRNLFGSGACAMLMAAALAILSNSSAQIGTAVPPSLAMTLRGGDPDPSCNWFKSVECKQAVRADMSACPAQTYYCRESQGSGAEYVKSNGVDYCGTQREGAPGVYDCASVMIDTAGCVK